MNAPHEPVAVARRAMATRFEVVLHGNNPVALRAAAEEALSEIERIEAHLSFYRVNSLVSKINARAAFEPVRVDRPVLHLLQTARRLYDETEGAFDITVAPLMRAWGFVGGSGHLPDLQELAEARARVGMGHILLDEEKCAVRFDRPGVMIDLGAIGKGYALDCAAELLREAGVTSGIIHGGTSTVCTIGKPPGIEPWKVAIEKPGAQPGQDPSASLLAVVPLRDETLSVSAVWGKAFQTQDRLYGHVLDPRSGEPVVDALLAAVVTLSATEGDALSTGLLIGGKSLYERLVDGRPGIRLLVVGKESDGDLRVHASPGMQLYG